MRQHVFLTQKVVDMRSLALAFIEHSDFSLSAYGDSQDGFTSLVCKGGFVDELHKIWSLLSAPR